MKIKLMILSSLFSIIIYYSCSHESITIDELEIFEEIRDTCNCKLIKRGIASVWNEFYWEGDKVVRSELHDAGTGIRTYHLFYYDDLDDKLIRREGFGASGEMGSYLNYFYNVNGKLYKILGYRKFGEDFRLRDSTSLEYSFSNEYWDRYFKKIYFDGYSESSSEIEFDSIGNTLIRNSYSWSRFFKIEEFTYDDKLNPEINIMTNPIFQGKNNYITRKQYFVDEEGIVSLWDSVERTLIYNSCNYPIKSGELFTYEYQCE